MKIKKSETENEIQNIYKAIEFIEEHTNEETKINRAFISEIHKILTKNLTPLPKGEGSYYPGELRKHDVTINNSSHKPPSYLVLQDYFDKFINFTNIYYKEQNQLLMVAISLHRFQYIHPFDNGNGRMGRLLNYVFLIKLGFKVKNGRIINLSSIFYNDINKYYDMLSKADSLKDKDILNWCQYFLQGLKNEIEKIDSLLNKKYVKNSILFPILKFALENTYITSQEFKILEYLIKNLKYQ